MQNVAFQKGKKKREELWLPGLRFVVATDWIDKLGPKAFCAWLKFHTWVDRRDEEREYDKIPYTLEDVAKKLGMSKSTLYRSIIRPLWEYYLIDLEEYTKSERKTQKPINIIVYESPMNSHETEIKPLEKLRDWEKDYGSAGQIFGRKGGRPKKDESDDPYRFKNETVGKPDLNRFKNKTVYRFKNKTVTVSFLKPNNYSNKLFILSNKPNNVSNNHHQKPIDDDGQLSQSQIEKINSKWIDCFGIKNTLDDNETNKLIQAAKEGLLKEWSMDQITNDMIVDYIIFTCEKVLDNIEIKTTPFACVRHYLTKNIEWKENEPSFSEQDMPGSYLPPDFLFGEDKQQDQEKKARDEERKTVKLILEKLGSYSTYLGMTRDEFLSLNREERIERLAKLKVEEPLLDKFLLDNDIEKKELESVTVF